MTLAFFKYQPPLRVRLHEAWSAFECAVGMGRSIKHIAHHSAVTKRPVADDIHVEHLGEYSGDHSVNIGYRPLFNVPIEYL